MFRGLLCLNWGFCNGRIIKWGVEKWYVIFLFGGRKNCIIMFFMWRISFLWGFKSFKSLKVKIKSREFVILVVDDVDISINNYDNIVV